MNTLNDIEIVLLIAILIVSVMTVANLVWDEIRTRRHRRRERQHRLEEYHRAAKAYLATRGPLPTPTHAQKTQGLYPHASVGHRGADADDADASGYLGNRITHIRRVN